MKTRVLLRNLLRLGLGLIGLVVVLGLGATGALYVRGHRPLAGSGQYVALGSSFAAGPGIEPTAPNSPSFCLRSANNYAHYLAVLRHLELTDVTCSGATALHVLEGGQYLQQPQLDALRPETQLVTLTAGGNDVGYLPNLIAWSCPRDPAAVPLMARLACRPTSDEEVDRRIAALPERFARIGREVHQRAPHAVFVIVDYTTVLPEQGACAERLPLSETELRRARLVEGELRRITAEAAAKVGAILVRASDVTRGHDVCSADPWVFGFTFARQPSGIQMMPYHPTEAAMRAIASAIDAAVSPAQGTPPQPVEPSPK